MKTFVKSMLRRLGWEIRRLQPAPKPDDFDERFCDLSQGERVILRAVRPYTMTSPERIATVILAIKHIVHAGVPGDIVECGVWRGGSMMAAALTLKSLGDTTRSLHLYDTFEGMSEATPRDVCFDGQPASVLLERDPRGTGIWCYASLEDVQRNLRSTGYPEEKINFLRGRVEDTIPPSIPDRIALLRLDTDWYESTRHELVYLYPRLQSAGLLIVDDYGHWQGAQQAVDEYLRGLPNPSYLHRIDYTGRVLVKTID